MKSALGNALSGVLRIAFFVTAGLGLFPAASSAENPLLSTSTRNISQSIPPQVEDFNAEIAIVGSTVHTAWLTRNEDWTYSLYYRRSTNAGKTWDPKILLHTFVDLNDDGQTKRRLAAIGNTVHIILADYTEGSNWQGYLGYFRSVDAGASFEPLRTLFTGAPITHVYDPFIVADGGVLSIVFRYQSNWQVNNSGILLNSTDRGGHFTQHTVYSTDTGTGWTIGDVRRSGQCVYVMYIDHYYYYGMQYGNLYVASSTDGGNTFASHLISIPSKNGNHKAFPLQDAHYVPKIAALEEDVHVVWSGLDGDDIASVFTRRSTDGGKTFSDAVNLTSGTLPAGLTVRWGHETTAAGGNYVYVLFNTEQARVFLRPSADSGLSFLNPQELTRPGYNDISGGWWPMVQVDPTDPSGKVVHVLWSWPTYLKSTNGGQTFTNPLLVSPHWSWWGSQGFRRPQMVIDGSGTVHWIGEGIYSGGSDYDIFYRRLTPSPTPLATNKALSLPYDYGKEIYGNMQVPAGKNINFTTALTVEAWVKPTRESGADGYFIFKADPGKGGAWGSYLLGQWRDGKLDARITTTDGGFVLSGGDPLPDGVWSHVAMVYNSGLAVDNFKIYVNGELAGVATAKGKIATRKGSLFVGGRDYYHFPGTVVVDELRLWKIARKQADIKATMKKKLSGTETGLQAYYPLDGSTRDTTGHGNHGTLMYTEKYVPGRPFSD